jgi:16S rRNA G966 N2-methylase RsmD
MADEILANVKIITIIKNVSAAILLLLCSYNFYKSYNTRYFNEWGFQANTKQGIEYLRNVNAKYVGMDIWHYSVFVNYYSIAFPDRYGFKPEFLGIKEMLHTTDTTRFAKFDYLFLSPPYNENNIVLEKWKVQTYFKESGARILVKK